MKHPMAPRWQRGITWLVIVGYEILVELRVSRWGRKPRWPFGGNRGHGMTDKNANPIIGEAILDGLAAPIVDWAADGTVLYANAAFCALTGRTRAELIGAYFYSIVFPSDLADQWDQPRLEFFRREAVSGHVVEMRTKQGDTLGTAVLRFSSSGRLHSILVIGLDVAVFTFAQREIRNLATDLAKIHELGDASVVTS